METRKQTFLKAVGWEALSFILTLVVSYYVVGDIDEATTLSVALLVLKVNLLFIYERLFRKIRKIL